MLKYKFIVIKMIKNQKKINSRFFIVMVLYFILVIDSCVYINFNISNENILKNYYNKNIESQIVTSSEIYSEQISIFISGKYSLIRQSYLTNDTNIYKGFDYNDPAFTDCSIFIGASNGIVPKIYPSPYGVDIFSTENLIINKPFFGFLYYETKSSTNTTMYGRSRRALKIIQETFNIEIFELDNQGMDNWYPFIGYYPNWSLILDEISDNAPKDGYWGALNIGRLKSEDYLKNNHISVSLIMFQTMEYLINGINLTEQYFGYSLKNYKFSFLENNSLNNLIANLFTILGGQMNGTDLSSIGFFDVNSFIYGGSKVIMSILQYEGDSKGIEKYGNYYKFNLSTAMGINKNISKSLSPSSKIYNGFIGALFTTIDVSVYSADIVSWEPKYLNWSTYLLDTIKLLAFLTNQDINVSMIENYSLILS